MVLSPRTTRLQKCHPLHIRCLPLEDHRVLCWWWSSLHFGLRVCQGTKAYDGTQVPYMMGHLIDKDVLWADYTCNTSTCIRGRTLSIRGPHLDTIAYVSHLLLFGLIWRESIDTFQLDAVVMNQVGRGSQQWHIILGVTLYQSTASIIEHCFLAAICFTLWWHRSTMPSPEGTCTQRKCSWIPHSLRKSLKTLLWNAVSLSTSISAGAPHSQNRFPSGW